MSGTLGIATFAYAPYALFNLICPLLAIAYGYFNFKQMPLSRDSVPA
jgi:NhaC family Na+:H+ antiporter